MGLVRKIRRAINILRWVNSTYGDMLDLPTLRGLKEHLRPYASTSLGLTDAQSLDVGCGGNPRNPFQATHVFGLDIRENPGKNVRCADLAVDPIPFPAGMFDYVTAYDFIEHVPRVIYLPERRFPFVELMNEVWRVLKPGGIFLSHTPIFPYSPAFRDPTHVNIVTHETFSSYFDNEKRWAAMYGFRGSFEVLSQAAAGPYLITLLRKAAI